MTISKRLIGVSTSCLMRLAISDARGEELKAAKVAQPPKLDGSGDDAPWKIATELKLEADGRRGDAKGKSVTVTLKAAHDKENVYFLLRW